MAKKKKQGRPAAYNSKQITQHLREMAAVAHEMLEDGTVMTRGEALALLLWKKALGYTERKVDDEGDVTVTEHNPASWAIQMVYERMEGKTPLAMTEDDTKVKASAKVRELATARLNQLSKQHIDETPIAPPTLPPPSVDEEPSEDAE